MSKKVESPFGHFAITYCPSSKEKTKQLARLDYPVSRGFMLSITDSEAEDIAEQNEQAMYIHGSAATQRAGYVMRKVRGIVPRSYVKMPRY